MQSAEAKEAQWRADAPTLCVGTGRDRLLFDKGVDETSPGWFTSGVFSFSPGLRRNNASAQNACVEFGREGFAGSLKMTRNADDSDAER